jgi:DNA primase
MTKRSASDLIERCRRIPIEPILKELGAASVPHGNAEWLRMLCPFHDESRPSASVSHTQKKFRCHGCKIHGDAVALLMEMRHLEFRSAVEEAERIAGISGQAVSRKRRRSNLGILP